MQSGSRHRHAPARPRRGWATTRHLRPLPRVRREATASSSGELRLRHRWRLRSFSRRRCAASGLPTTRNWATASGEMPRSLPARRCRVQSQRPRGGAKPGERLSRTCRGHSGHEYGTARHWKRECPWRELLTMSFITSVALSGSGAGLLMVILGAGSGSAPTTVPGTWDLNVFSFQLLTHHCPRSSGHRCSPPAAATLETPPPTLSP